MLTPHRDTFRTRTYREAMESKLAQAEQHAADCLKVVQDLMSAQVIDAVLAERA